MDKTNQSTTKKVRLIFHDSFHDYIQDWRTTIATINRNHSELPINELPEYEVLSPEVIELIVKLCAQLGIPPDAEFAILDTFDYFSINYFKYLLKAEKDWFALNSNLEQPQPENWLADYYADDLLLFILVTIMLVSKYNDINYRLDVPKIKSYLAMNKIEKSVDEIKEKEFLVFRTIGFKIRSPIAFEMCEFLLRVCLNPMISKIDEIFDLCIIVLRFVYFQRNLIYKRFAGSNGTNITNEKMMKADKILLGGAVVLAAAKLINMVKDKLAQLLRSVSDEIGYAEWDLILLSEAIFKAILE